MKFNKFLLAIFFSIIFSNNAFSMDTVAKQAIMIDFDTGQIILEKNPDELMKPASMAKLMTIYIVFEKIKNNSISLDDEFIVSEKAWKKRGSRTFLEPGQNVTVSDLLRGEDLTEQNVSIDDASMLSTIGTEILKLLGNRGQGVVDFSNIENGSEVIQFLKRYNKFNGKPIAELKLPIFRIACKTPGI